MTALSIQPTYPIFTDIDGQPLEAGYIFIGVANLAPIGNPINVYWDAALTLPAAQPIRTIGGYPVNAGTPARLYVNSDYSIQVQNRNGSVVYSAPAATERLSGVVIEVDATDVSFIQAGVGAVTRTAQSKMRDAISALDFGAVGNGIADDTAAIQLAIDALPVGGVLDGLGRQFIVTSLLLKSNMVMQNFRLKTKAGNTDFVAPITIDGNVSAKTNILLTNINVDGNRQNQTDINSPSEDGGRHGFRILGNVSNLTLSNCSAVYCATDGFTLFSSSAKPATDTYAGLCFQNIRFENCFFDWNRRHGFSADSVNIMKLIGCDARNNGKDLDTTSPLNSGMRGARFGGNLYGRSFDFEGYGVGTAIHDVEIIGGDFTKNIGGALFYDGVNPAAAGFLPRRRIRISNAHFDVLNAAFDASFSVSAPSATASLHVFEDFNISNCRFDNWIQLKGVNGIYFDGGSVLADYAGGLYYALVELSKNWLFNIRTNKQSIIYDNLPFTVTRANVIGAPTFSSENLQLIGFTTNGWFLEYTANLTGAVATGYYSTFTVSANYRIRLISGSYGDGNGPTTEKYWMNNLTDESLIGACFDISGAGARFMSIRYEVIPNGA